MDGLRNMLHTQSNISVGAPYPIIVGGFVGSKSQMHCEKPCTSWLVEFVYQALNEAISNKPNNMATSCKRSSHEYKTIKSNVDKLEKKIVNMTSKFLTEMCTDIIQSNMPQQTTKDSMSRSRFNTMSQAEESFMFETLNSMELLTGVSEMATYEQNMIPSHSQHSSPSSLANDIESSATILLHSQLCDVNTPASAGILTQCIEVSQGYFSDSSDESDRVLFLNSKSSDLSPAHSTEMDRLPCPAVQKIRFPSECSMDSTESCDSFIVFEEQWDGDEFDEVEDLTDDDFDVCFEDPVRLSDVNANWDAAYSTPSDSQQQEDDASSTRVKFNEKNEIHVMHVWDFAYRKARLGPWEQIARDRVRFHDRIARLEPVLARVLTPSHRRRMFKRIQS